MDLAILIAVGLVVLAVGAVLLGATFGVPGAIKETPKPRLSPYAAGGIPAGQIQHVAVASQAERPVAASGLTVRRERGAGPAIPPSVLAGVVTLALIIIALGAYFVWLPAQATYAADRQLQDSVAQGATLFSQDCAGCHGPIGAGAVGPNLHVYAANGAVDPNGIATRHQINPSDPSSMASLRDLVVLTISHGRSGTAMPAWGRDTGGPLNDSQIASLADLIVTNGWAAVVPVSAATPATGESPAAVADAQKVIQKYDCGSCHTISAIQGAVGTVGPNLSVEGTVPKIPASSGNLDNTPENMQRWILDAPAIKPGVVMPNFSAAGMSTAEARTVADYLETLKPTAPAPVAAAPVAPAAPAAGATPAPAAAGAAPAAGAAEGQALITKYGCGACHTISSVQGAIGTIGPDLSKEGSQPKIPRSTGNLDNTPQNLQTWIFNAPAVKPGIVMPNFSAAGMSQADAKTIADYLETLK